MNVLERNTTKRVLSITVVINLLAVILSSFSEFSGLKILFAAISFFSALIFTVEYICRIYYAPTTKPEVKSLRARISYIFSFFGVVDFVSITPFILGFYAIVAPEQLYIIELSKVLLMIKLIRYSRTLLMIIEVFKSVAMELIFGWSVALSVVIFAGVAMYYVERAAQPDVFYNVGQGLWWSIITFATVGYGDIFPITVAGKILAGIIAMIGIGMLALPTAIISSAFIKKVQQYKGKKAPKEINDDKNANFCPCCGQKLNKDKNID